MGFGVALPRRLAGFFQDARRLYPPPLEVGGVVASPSRLAAFTGNGIPQAPGPRWPERVRGPVRFRLPIISRDNPFPLAWPLGAGVVHYHRGRHANIDGIAQFDTLRQARTAGTTNVAEACGTPASPIPWDYRRSTLTFYREFDNRIQAPYWGRPAIQMGQVPRYVAQGMPGPVMLQPYFPRLTRMAPSTSYGQTTATLGR